MPTRAERGKERKFVRAPGGTRIKYFTGKSGKHQCAACGEVLHGVPHGKSKCSTKKLPKSGRRPSVPFGGVLCTKCRTLVFEEGAMVQCGIKKVDDVSIKLRGYVTSSIGGNK